MGLRIYLDIVKPLFLHFYYYDLIIFNPKVYIVFVFKWSGLNLAHHWACPVNAFTNKKGSSTPKLFQGQKGHFSFPIFLSL